MVSAFLCPFLNFRPIVNRKQAFAGIVGNHKTRQNMEQPSVLVAITSYNRQDELINLCASLQDDEHQSIIRGYRKRDRLTHQLIAEAVFAAMHTMRDSKGKTVKDFFPMLFDDPDDDDRDAADITDEEIAQLQAEMDAWNMANNKQEAPDES